ncbi:Outer membrane protein beta-barrel domain-containing protein [Ekhidna lutea]|uniref:Outer membrane protein beta-barrel domain-containing protein n=1 Tax=Ekhidna lutea TaxID=447679 RepID=A0A239JPE2_EKHLU|nr:outer membrane beta-barrel protein [Ekhidna lutea]SNT07203.1 Outer membrane protein beta-barrel domain-containing protein [Ekhidna lutea]
MKRLLLLTFLAGSFGLANAQTEEGGWLVGATSNLNFTSTKADGADNSSNHFGLNAGAGYFVIDNLAAGLNLGFNSFSEGDVSGNSFLIGPFARYYVNGVFFVGASFSSESGSSENEFTEFDYSRTIFGLEAGYPVWIVDNVAVEPALVYTSRKSDDFVNSNSFGLNVGFRLYF